MKDYIVRGTAAGDQIRAFAIRSRELVQTAHERHKTSPIASAALGRSLSAALMMGAMMKGEDDELTLQFLADGPLGNITVTADSRGHAKGFVGNTEVYLPARTDGHLDVGSAVGGGILRVIKDLGLKEPYVGTVDIQTGEIAEDLTYYFAASEQVPSAAGLGVLVGRDENILAAGGFILQLMPDTEDAVIDLLEQNLSRIPDVTEMLASGRRPEDMLDQALAGLEPKMRGTLPAAFRCDCCRDKVERTLISLSDRELREMIDEGKTIEVKCQFCGRAYHFTSEELIEIRDSARAD